MTKLLIRSACVAPLLAWCCCGLGMSFARRSKVRARWRREVPDELHELATELPRTRSAGTSRRDDLHAVPRAATPTHTQGCDTCRTLLRAMERESRLLTRAMLEEEEPLPARIAAFQERVYRSMQWI